MKNNSLRVYFHKSLATPNPHLSLLENIARSHVPTITEAKTNADHDEMKHIPAHEKKFYWSHVSGDDYENLAQNIIRFSGDRRSIVISLCDEMLAAASKAGLPSITCGLPAEISKSPQMIIASPLQLPRAINELAMEISR